MWQSSENAEEKFTCDSIREESRDHSHHCPASVIHFTVLHGGEETFTVVVFHHHLGFFGKQIVLTELVCCDCHGFVTNLYILYSKKRGASSPLEFRFPYEYQKEYFTPNLAPYPRSMSSSPDPMKETSP